MLFSNGCCIYHEILILYGQIWIHRWVLFKRYHSHGWDGYFTTHLILMRLFCLLWLGMQYPKRWKLISSLCSQTDIPFPPPVSTFTFSYAVIMLRNKTLGWGEGKISISGSRIHSHCLWPSITCMLTAIKISLLRIEC